MYSLITITMRYYNIEHDELQNIFNNNVIVV